MINPTKKPVRRQYFAWLREKEMMELKEQTECSRKVPNLSEL
jgi:hypothetical protein